MHKFLNKKKNKKVEAAVKPMMNTLYAKDNDPFGSYTGKPADKKERPVQDQDDL